MDDEGHLTWAGRRPLPGLCHCDRGEAHPADPADPPPRWARPVPAGLSLAPAAFSVTLSSKPPTRRRMRDLLAAALRRLGLTARGTGYTYGGATWSTSAWSDDDPT